MIQRLIELTLREFRCYRQPAAIPLDADVVVVYGTNGSGKTSLFSALEYALTGSVSHLASYDSDYPRCLQHVRANEPGSVSVTYRSPEGQQHIARSLRVGEKLLAGTQLTRSDAQFYRERCYLSQDQLSRLFDDYGEGQKKDREQPLVRFARDLLNLDALENITDGLHVALDLRRLDKASTQFRTLREEREGLPRTRKTLTEGVSIKRIGYEAAIVRVEELFRDRIGPHGHVEWNETTLRNRRETVESDRANANRQGQIDVLQRDSGSLDTAIRVLESAMPSQGEDVNILNAKLTGAEKELGSIRLALTGPLKSFETVLSQSFPSEFRSITFAEVDRRLDACEAAVARIIQAVETRAREAAQARAQIQALELSRQKLQQQIAEISGEPSADTVSLQDWLETLLAVSRHLHDDECPVCQRDYSELKAGPLKRKLELEVERLGGNVTRLNELATRRAQLETELSQVSGRLVALTERIDREANLFAAQESAGEILKSLAAREIPALTNDRARIAGMGKDITDLREKIRNLERQGLQRQEVEKQIAEVATKLDVARTDDLRQWAQTTRNAILKQIERLVSDERNSETLVSALALAEKAVKDLRQSESQLATFDIRRGQVEEAWKSADECITQAKALAEAATTAKKILLEEVFDGALNDLWKDLFRRLVKSDRFTPQLKLERRGRELRTQIEGHADGVSPFDHAGSVLSAGNFNTAAVSLFLSVHLLEQPKHEVLLLDDPVQNIDDVHVIQLASLLRTIAFDSKRQIVVGVHERAMFDYLCLELGPTKVGQSLLAIEVTGGADVAGTEVHAERRIWENDKLQLGA